MCYVRLQQRDWVFAAPPKNRKKVLLVDVSVEEKS
jgi:hypothetical protein